MANEERLTAKHYDGKGYYKKCSGVCHVVDLSCEDCVEMEKLVDRLGELEDEAEKTVDAVEVVNGRWEDMYDGKYDNYRFRCSVCKEKSLFKVKRDVLGKWIQVQALTDYCPNCGAKMDGDGNA